MKCEAPDKTFNPYRPCTRTAKWTPAQGAPFFMCGIHFRAWERSHRAKVARSPSNVIPFRR